MSIFVHEVIVVFVTDLRSICYEEVLSGNETVNAERYLGFLERVKQHWEGNQHAVVSQ